MDKNNDDDDNGGGGDDGEDGNGSDIPFTLEQGHTR